MPDEMAVVGFDNLPFAQYTIPPLTTIKQPIAKKSKWATNLLINQIEDKDGQVVHENLEPELIIRESCGAN